MELPQIGQAWSGCWKNKLKSEKMNYQQGATTGMMAKHHRTACTNRWLPFEQLNNQ